MASISRHMPVVSVKNRTDKRHTSPRILAYWFGNDGSKSIPRMLYPDVYGVLQLFLPSKKLKIPPAPARSIIQHRRRWKARYAL